MEVDGLQKKEDAVAVDKDLEYFDKPENLNRLAIFLRSSNGIKVRQGIEHDKRVDYFKGLFVLFVVVTVVGVYCFTSQGQSS